MSCLTLYEPINTLKPIGDSIWIVDGPEIGFRVLFLSVPFPTRMTVVRLSDGRLWVHSPTPLTPSLKDEIDALGPVAFLIAPNRIHYWWVADWQKAYPHAAVHVAPRVLEQAKERLTTVDAELGADPPAEWADEIDQVLVPGDYMSEAVFFHRASRTVILTDLIENFETDRITCFWLRTLVKLAGITHPNGTIPPDLRQTFRRNRGKVREAVEKILNWDAEKVVMAHGRWYRENGAAELARAFRWAM
ncbi:MAG: DUF4336 domain-containing protein [Hyphomicrobiales bacterium]|nr:MAG: DUF4336 domain-containing protein [Hyphomicrobiales bacterium]